MPRLFVAAWPPAEVVDRLHALPRPSDANVRWVPAEQWHVTLRFLGEADTDEVASRLARVELPRVTAVVGPEVRRLGRGMLVVPVAGVDELSAVVHRATDGLGQPPEQRGFRGHLTLARRRRDAPLPIVGEAVSAAFDVDEVLLVQSDLGERGAAYTTVGRWPTV